MHIHNPTTEDIATMYAGKPFIFIANSTKNVDDKAAANHIMNEYGRRGLVSLDYGDDTTEVRDGKTIKDIKVEAGLAANKAFRIKTVIDHNQHNEAQKTKHLPYIKPSELCRKYAAEEGLELLSPYEVQNVVAEEANRLKKENAELMQKMVEQSKRMDEILSAMQKGGQQIPPEKTAAEKKEEESAAKLEGMRAQFRAKKRNNLQAWIKENKDEIALWPETIKSEIRQLFTETYGGEISI